MDDGRQVRLPIYWVRASFKHFNREVIPSRRMHLESTGLLGDSARVRHNLPLFHRTYMLLS